MYTPRASFSRKHNIGNVLSSIVSQCSDSDVNNSDPHTAEDVAFSSSAASALRRRFLLPGTSPATPGIPCSVAGCASIVASTPTMGAGGEGCLALDRIAAAATATAGAVARPRPNPNVAGAVGVKANAPRRQ